MKESMFAQLFTKLQMLEKQDGIKRTITLDRQYRMHPTLGTYIDNNFYRKYSESEHVGNGIEDPAPFSHRLPGIENKACVWYNVPYDGETAGERAKSKFRRREAEAIARHVKKMLTSEAGRDFQYGIITFYREQVNEICRALAAPDIQVYVRDEDGHYRINPVYSSRRGGPSMPSKAWNLTSCTFPWSAPTIYRSICLPERPRSRSVCSGSMAS